MTLALAFCTCERFYGSAFVFDPRRWRTTDGYVPARVLAVAALGQQAIQADEVVAASTAALVPHQDAATQQSTLEALRARARGH